VVGAGTEPAEIAVLYRINAQSEVYEEALTEAGIPFQVRGGEGFFSRQEVRQALVALQRAAERDTVTEDLSETVRALLEPLGLTAEPPAGTRARERWEALDALAQLVDDEIATRPGLDLPTLVAELRVRADARHPPVVRGVTLASLHAAKGLEWDAVYLVGLVDGTLPIQHAEGDDAAIEEERRLLYVGITRARRLLSLSWALSRQPGGGRRRRRSRFLYGLIPDEHPAARVPTGGRTAGAAKPRCRVCGKPLLGTMAMKLRRCDDCPSNVDVELLDRLKEWRRNAAKEQQVPAYVVFTDATLTAIAEGEPSSEADLSQNSGVGARKLGLYGAQVLQILGGADASQVIENASAATESE